MKGNGLPIRDSRKKTILPTPQFSLREIYIGHLTYNYGIN